MLTAIELSSRYSEFKMRGAARVLFHEPLPPVLWSGRTGDMKNNSIVALKLGHNAILKELQEELATLSVYSPGSYLFGRDFSLHTTVKQGKGMLSAEAREVLIPSLLVPRLLTFDRVVLDPVGNVLLTSTEIPQGVAIMRAQVSAALTDLGVESVPIEILHASLCRFTDARSWDTGWSHRCGLVELVHKYDQLLQQKKIHVPVQELFVGSLYDLLAPPDT